MTEKIRREIPLEEFDYQMLLHCLRDYLRPRDKIRALLKSGVIIRAKKGLYTFGPDYRRRPLSRELLANLIYGPSYISLDYALSYYGLIPERVETVTSVTCGKNRAFNTPLGHFTYWAVPMAFYRVGIDIVQIDKQRSFFIATREKALTDKICRDREYGLRKLKDFETYLLDFLRIDPIELSKLDPRRIKEIAYQCRSRKGVLLSQYIWQFKEESVYE